MIIDLLHIQSVHHGEQCILRWHGKDWADHYHKLAQVCSLSPDPQQNQSYTHHNEKSPVINTQ